MLVSYRPLAPACIVFVLNVGGTNWDVMKIALILCGVAAAEIVVQPSICIDPPPRSSNASLDAVVERALAKLAAPSLSWQSFMRGATLADRAVSVVRSVIEGGTATVWNVERAYRTGRGRGCRVGGRGVYHDHALCRRARIGAATT